MARINVESSIFNDGRFKALEIKHGPITAIGIVVTSFKMAQTYWLKDRSLIPIDEFLFNPIFEDMIKVGLAEKRDMGIYIKGSEDQFAWIEQRQKASKKGGEKNKEKITKNKEKWLKNIEGNSQNKAGIEPEDSRNEAGIKPDDSPLYSSLSSLYSNTNTLLSTDVDVAPCQKGEKKNRPQEIMELFNADSQKNLMPSLKILTPKRIAWIKKADKIIQTNENWQKIFEIAGTKFFKKQDGTSFQPTFDFIFEKERYVKYLEEIDGGVSEIDRMSEKDVVAAMFGGYQID